MAANESGERDDRQLTRRTIGGFLWAFGGLGTQQLLRVLVLAILARLLTPSMFGIVGAALIVINFSDIFSQLGVGPAIVQHGALTEAHVRTGFMLSVALGFLFGAAVYLAAPAIESLFRIAGLAPYLRALAIVFPIRGFGVVSDGLLTRNMRFRRTAAIAILSYLFGYGVVSVTLALRGWGAWSIVYGQIAQVLLITLGNVVSARHRLLPQFDRPAARHIVYFGATLSASRIGSYLAQNADNFIVGRWLGAAALGLYSRAYFFLMQPANLFGSVVDQVLYPAMARAQNDPDRLARAYRIAVGFVAMTTLPLSVFLILLAPEIVAILLGPKWTGVVLPFQILTASLVCRTGYKMSDTLARATGAIGHTAWRQWLYFFLIVAGAWLGRSRGVEGVAAGVALALLVQYLVMLELGLRLVPVSLPQIGAIHARHLLVAIAVGALAFAGAHLARGAGVASPLVILAAAIPAAGGVLLLWSFAPWLFGEEAQILLSFVRFPARRRSERLV